MLLLSKIHPPSFKYITGKFDPHFCLLLIHISTNFSPTYLLLNCSCRCRSVFTKICQLVTHISTNFSPTFSPIFHLHVCQVSLKFPSSLHEHLLVCQFYPKFLTAIYNLNQFIHSLTFQQLYTVIPKTHLYIFKSS